MRKVPRKPVEGAASPGKMCLAVAGVSSASAASRKPARRWCARASTAADKYATVGHCATTPGVRVSGP
eukprot:1195386-Prorocentrum_minimum.AAC.4